MVTFFVNENIEKERYDLCKSCEQFSETLKLCMVCKCFMPGKVKIGFSSCPLDKWHEIKPENN